MLSGKELAGEVINVGTGVDVKVNELAEQMVKKIQGVNKVHIYGNFLDTCWCPTIN